MSAFKGRILSKYLEASEITEIFFHIASLEKYENLIKCFCNLIPIRFLDFKFCVQMEDTKVGECTPGRGVGELLNTSIHSRVVESV